MKRGTDAVWAGLGEFEVMRDLDPNPLHVLAFCAGVLPAFLLTMLAMIGLGLLEGWSRVPLLASFIGTAGLIWGFQGATSQRNWILIGMLVIGELGMLPLVATFVNLLTDPHASCGKQLLMAWFTLGPMVTGGVLIRTAVQRACEHSGQS